MPRRIRRTKITRLIYCEGAHDKAFLNTVKFMYIADRYNIDIKSGTGGNQIHLIEEAIRMGEGYDEVFIQLDNDRPAAEIAVAEQLAREKNITVLRTTPFMEKILIAIIEPAKNTNGWSAIKSKRYFQATYIPANKRTDTRAYRVYFTQDKLNAAKIVNDELGKIIRAFQ